MPVELRVPEVGESITEVQIGEHRKREGDQVEKDENLVEIETDKATVEIPAPIAGTLTKWLKKNGDSAMVGEVIGYMEAVGAAAPAVAVAAPSVAAPSVAAAAPVHHANDHAAEAKAQAAKSIETSAQTKEAGKTTEVRRDGAVKPTTADRTEKALIVSPDVPRPKEASSPGTQLSTGPETVSLPLAGKSKGAREEEIVPMSPIRRRIAQRLVEAQQTAALLTTFNEVDMSAVMALRNEHKQTFQDRYGVKLGFMSFFVKASIDALKLVPQVNAYIRGNDIVYHNFYDIGIAVGGGKGLVVPILRDADRMSFAEIELAISDLATRARQNSLQLDELQGGTFTISNGGVYGSLLSTPIVNPPQSGILGLHTIQDRVVPRNGEIVIRPIMNLALTYDHRIVDGQGAVTFLKRIKDVIEEPMRMLVEV